MELTKRESRYAGVDGWRYGRTLQGSAEHSKLLEVQHALAGSHSPGPADAKLISVATNGPTYEVLWVPAAQAAEADALLGARGFSIATR